MRHRPKFSATALAIATLGAIVACPKPANAQVTPPKMEWVAVDTPGCASSIAVGPNNVPWIIGCTSYPYSPNITGPEDIYYLSDGPNAPPNLTNTCGSNGIAPCPPHWVSDGTGGIPFNAVTLAVNLDGLPYASDAQGDVYSDIPCNAVLNPGAGCGVPLRPNAYWIQVTTRAVSSFVVSSSTFTGLVPGEVFETNAQNAAFMNSDTYNVWGVGCGSNCSQPLTGDGSLYIGTVSGTGTISAPGENFSGWAPMPSGGAANTFALFTDPPSVLAPNQNPWVLDSAGGVFSWDGREWVPQTLPEPVSGKGVVLSLTDHFALERVVGSRHHPGYPGIVYQWTGTASGGEPGWAPYITDYDTTLPSGFVDIVKIAYSEAINTPSGTFGPSMLWGVDLQGNVYSAQLVSNVTPP